MCDFSRCGYVVVCLMALVRFSDSLMENVTVVECDGSSTCTVSCYDGNSPYNWNYATSLKNPWRILEGNHAQQITVKRGVSGYYNCLDSSSSPLKIFYVVGKKVCQQPASSGALTAVIVLAVVFGIGFMIMVALAALKFYRGRASHAMDDGVTVREGTQEYDEVCRTIRQSSMDDDGYIVPLNPPNRDSDYLEVMNPPGLSNHSTRNPSCGPLYENLENVRKPRVSTNWH